ncbi:MAG: chemotaxis protein CheA [Longimicrobiaceae bacterium]
MSYGNGEKLVRQTACPETTLTEPFDLSELLDEYRDEARDQIARLDAALGVLERGDALPEEERRALLRDLHTLKGNSGMLGFVPLRDAIHALESVFKASPGPYPRPKVERLGEAASALRGAVEVAGSEEEAAAFGRLASVRRALAGVGGKEPAESESPQPTPGKSDGESRADRRGDLLRVSFSKLDRLVDEVGELVGLGAGLETWVEQHRRPLAALDPEGVLRDHTDLLDGLIGRIREAVMELRLVPLGRVFDRFPGLVRDLARAGGKRVQLELEGADTEVDKATADLLGEPLLHLIQNAVDHGIEPADQREKAGKPAEGTVRLAARQAGDRVTVTVEDDGRGLDRAAILARAREQGLAAEGEGLAPNEVEQLLFRSGFSTRAEASEVSGRGVGLEVVNRRMRELRGSLEVESRPGGGTRFTLSLPLTVVILPAVLFEAGGQAVALPAAAVSETVRNPAPERVGGSEAIRVRNELVPVARLKRVLWNENGQERGQGGYFMVVRGGGRSAAVAADRLLDQRDVVVKALPRYLGKPRAVSGVTVLPDGRAALVLDPGAVIDLNLTSTARDR